jgi:hypothetical protein
MTIGFLYKKPIEDEEENFPIPTTTTSSRTSMLRNPRESDGKEFCK